MRARGQSRGTNIANHLTLLHPDAGLDTTFDPGHVQILRGVGAIVLDFHVVTIGASVASRDDTTLRRGQNGGALWGSVIRAQVSLPSPLHRMESLHGVARRDATKFQWRTQESPPQ